LARVVVVRLRRRANPWYRRHPRNLSHPTSKVPRMRILDLPTSERPRERLAALGPAALADRELIAGLLGTGGRPGHGRPELAARLLTRFGSVTALARAHPCDLADIAGIGQAKAMAMAAAFELGRRADLPDPSRTISTTADLVAVVLPFLRGRSCERLVLVVCD